MHSLNIIHHDIKPENIMYSNEYKKFVMIDFGFTKTVDSNLG
jgi:serine/threonine protein kinase